ncbi:hypothetical protein Tco_0602462 [Tanacetum coccineum]
MRDFHKTHPSGSGTVTKTAPSASNIKPSVTNEGTDVKPGVPDVTEEESSESEAESWGNDEDDSNNEQDSRSKGCDEENDSDDKNTQSDSEKGSDSEHEIDENESGSESDHEENEEEDEDDEEEEEDDQLYADVDIRLNELVQADDETVQKEGTYAELTNIQQGNENPEISQVIKDAHVTLSTKRLKFQLLALLIHLTCKQTPTLLTLLVSVTTESSPIYSTIIPQSLPSFTPPPQQSISTPPPITEATNPQSALLDFALVFQFNNKVTELEKEVDELKKDDPLKTQVTTLVDEHLDARLGATKDEFMNFLSVSLTKGITKQVKNQLPQILPGEEYSQPQSSYEAAATLIEFELKKILIDKMDKSESYLAAPEHREFYEGLIKSYILDKTLFSTYDKVYSLKRSRKYKDKDKDPSVGSDRGLNKRKTSKDTEPTKGPKAKESQSGLSKGDKSQSKSSRKSVQSEGPEFEITDSDMPQDQEENPGPTQSWLMTLALSADKPSKTFDELMSTPIEFSAYIMNSLKITNLTQEILLGPAFRLHKGTRSNYAELKYDFEECYKALSEKLD